MDELCYTTYKKLGLASVNEKRDNESSNICYLLLLEEAASHGQSLSQM